MAHKTLTSLAVIMAIIGCLLVGYIVYVIIVWASQSKITSIVLMLVVGTLALYKFDPIGKLMGGRV